MNMVLRSAIAMSALNLLVSGYAARAQSYYPNNATISSAVSSSSGQVFIGTAASLLGVPTGTQTSPTVKITNGASFSATGVIKDLMIDVYNSSTLNVSGGTLAPIIGWGTSKINITGGTLHAGTTLVPSLEANDGSTINLTGLNLTDTLTSSGILYNKYTLSGDLENGTNVTGDTLWIGKVDALGTPKVHITNVPEPGAYALLGSLGLTVALLRRRK